MRRLYYLFWLVRVLAGAVVDIWDLIQHRKES